MVVVAPATLHGVHFLVGILDLYWSANCILHVGSATERPLFAFGNCITSSATVPTAREAIGLTANEPQGLHLHSTLAFSTQGTSLGFVDVQRWSRDAADFGKTAKRHRVPIEQKESFKWLKGLRAVAAVQSRCPGTTLVSVGDREADRYELFEEATNNPAGPKLLVRAEHNRQLRDDQQRLWETTQSRAAGGIESLQVPRQGSRAARVAHMSIRYVAVNMIAPLDTLVRRSRCRRSWRRSRTHRPG